jgi:hypothetical protein
LFSSSLLSFDRQKTRSDAISTIGALREIVEWIYDQLVAGNAILGKMETIIDMGMDAMGH